MKTKKFVWKIYVNWVDEFSQHKRKLYAKTSSETEANLIAHLLNEHNERARYFVTNDVLKEY